MTIRRGEEWGTTEPMPADGVPVRTDAEVRQVVQDARRRGEEPPPLGLLGGDLCRTVGGRGDEARLQSEQARRLPVDCGAVLLDGKLHWFVAHLVLRRSSSPASWWFGPLVAVMNAQFLGSWDVAPRSHPNDGRLDILEADLSFQDRVKARRRLPQGTHVPHPQIHERRVDAAQLEYDRPMAAWLDGVPAGSARRLSVRVEPGALTCYV